MLRDGLAAGGDRARAANYTAAVGVDDGRDRAARQHTGAETPFAASVVVNASGPWTDLTNLACGDPTDHMGGTKGSHIVLDHPELLAATGRARAVLRAQGRPDRPDLPAQGTRARRARPTSSTTWLDPIVCTEAEVDYFIDLVRQVLPDIAVDRDRRSSTASPASGRCPGHGNLAPGFVSREYRIESPRMIGGGDATVLSLVGGKWTTFRASAEHLADRALAPARPPTAPLHEGRADRRRPRIPDDRARAAAVDRTRTARACPLDRVATLLDRYGTVADDVIAAIADDPTMPRSTTLPAYSTAELRHLARTEDVVHLDDVLMRRTSLAFTGAVTADVGAEVAEAIAPVMGWDAAACRAETDRGARAGARRRSDVGRRGIRSLDRAR